MVAPLGSLMPSMEQIANDRRLSDDAYVFVKNGRVVTEGRLGHAFTFFSTKARSAQWIARAFSDRFAGEAGRAARNVFDRNLSGLHQVKVGDLRRAFRTAFGMEEAARLSEMAKTLRSRCGDAVVGDALAPLSEHLMAGGKATPQLIGKALDRAFGRGTAAVVMASRENVTIESLPDLMLAASDVQNEVQCLKNEPQRVLDAVFDVFRQGALTKAAVQATVAKRFAGSHLERLKTDLQALPENVTLAQAAKIFHKANYLRNRSEVMAFREKHVPDTAIAEALGLVALTTSGGELSAERREEILRQLPEVTRAAKGLRAAAKDFLAKHPKASSLCRDFVTRQAEQCIAAGELTPRSVNELRRSAEDFYRRETDFEYGVGCELAKHPGWTREQKALFSNVMKKVRQQFPVMNLFTDAPNPPAERAAAYVSGDGTLRPASAAHLGAEGQALCGALLTAGGDALAPLLLEALPALLREKAAADITLDDVVAHCCGSRAEAAGAGKRGDVEARVEQLIGRRITERLATDEDRAKALREARREHPRATEAEIQKLAQRQLDRDLTMPREIVFRMLRLGLSLDAAVACTTDRRRAVTLADFTAPPCAVLGQNRTEEEWLAGWLGDFCRQGEASSPQRSAQGATHITVTEPGGGVTTVHNGADGLAPEEVADFDEGKMTSRHRTLLAALERLCSSQAQRLAALATLTQSGPVGYNRTFARVVAGADPMLEHAAMNYRFTKNEEGDVILDMTSPAKPGAAQLQVNVVIHPDGAMEVAQFAFQPGTALAQNGAAQGLPEPAI